MKNIIAIALALCLACLPALGEAAREGIMLDVDGSSVTLNFDSSAEYSSVVNGSAVASFYIYTDGGEKLYELTMTFPEAVAAGDVVDTQFALNNPNCSVAAIFSSNEEAVYYFSGAIEGAAYPADSSFAITFDAVNDAEGGRTYIGRLDAHMVGMDMMFDSGVKTLDIDNAPFSFTMPSANRGELTDPFTPTPSPEPFEGYNPFDTVPPEGDGDLFGPSATPAPTKAPEREEVKV